jgi:hypothetical protein
VINGIERGHIYQGQPWVLPGRQCNRRWGLMRPVAKIGYDGIQAQKQASIQWVVPTSRLFDPLTIFGPVLAAIPVNLYEGENRT